MNKKDFSLADIIGVLGGRDVGKTKELVNLIAEKNERHSPTKKEIKECRDLINKKYNIKDSYLKEKIISLDKELDNAKTEEEAKNIIKKWRKKIAQERKDNLILTLEIKKRKEKNKKSFVPPY